MTQKIMDTNIDIIGISDDDRQRYIDWLKAEIALNDGYHNHKETMAWAATAFYLPAVLGLAYSANRFGLHCAWQIGLTVVLALLGVIVLRFLNMQFKMRWEAADAAVGLRRAMARVCDCTTTLSKTALELDCSDDSELEAYKGWPRFIRVEVKQEKQNSKPKRTCGKIALALFCWKKPDPRLLSESPTYYAVVIATVLGIILLWVDC